MFEGVLNMLQLKNMVGVRCPKRTLDAAKYNVNVRVYVLKYFNDINKRLTVQRAKIYELVFYLTRFSFNYFEVCLAVSFWLFRVEGCLLPLYSN